MSIGVVYVGLLITGVIYAVIAGALGWLSDLGGGEIEMDASGHLDAGHPHPLSGTTVATFVTGFGGGGIVGHYLFEWPPPGSLLLAVASGLALAVGAFGVLALLFKQTQAGAEFAVEAMIGREGEVITSIPAGGGAGEIAYVVKGQREIGMARSVDGSAVPRGRLVVIERILGPTLYVRSKS